MVWNASQTRWRKGEQFQWSPSSRAVSLADCCLGLPQYNVQLAEERWVHMKSLVISLYPRAFVSPLPLGNRGEHGKGKTANQEILLQCLSHMGISHGIPWWQFICYIHFVAVELTAFLFCFFLQWNIHACKDYKCHTIHEVVEVTVIHSMISDGIPWLGHWQALRGQESLVRYFSSQSTLS